MSNRSDKTITEIVQAVRESDEKKTRPYDTTATVTRVEDGKAWVHIPGGVAETPAELTINAKQGDSVMVRVAGGRAFLLGNATNPPTDDSTAETALANANDALHSAINARIAADSAEQSAEEAQASAGTAERAAAQAVTDASTAKTSASEAKADAAAAASAASQAQTSADSALSSAQSAQSSANGALKGLSTVQDVIGVLDWAKENATYTLTTDTDIVPGKTYWTRSGSGTEADPYVYNPVVNPVKAGLGNYYEISGVDEAMADYINTHLALTDEGLYVLGGANQWKVLIAPDGVYIIDGTTGVDKVVAKYRGSIVLGEDGELQTKIAPSRFAIGRQIQVGNSDNFFEINPFVCFTTNEENSVRIGPWSLDYYQQEGDTILLSPKPKIGLPISIRKSVAGVSVLVTRFYAGESSAQSGWFYNGGYRLTRNGGEGDSVDYYIGTPAESFSFGVRTARIGSAFFKEGANSVVFGENLIAPVRNMVAMGQNNLANRTGAFIIGNGTSDTARSNAFAVDWDGNTEMQGRATTADMTTAEITAFINELRGVTS